VTPAVDDVLLGLQEDDEAATSAGAAGAGEVHRLSCSTLLRQHHRGQLDLGTTMERMQQVCLCSKHIFQGAGVDTSREAAPESQSRCGTAAAGKTDMPAACCSASHPPVFMGCRRWKKQLAHLLNRYQRHACHPACRTSWCPTLPGPTAPSYLRPTGSWSSRATGAKKCWATTGEAEVHVVEHSVQELAAMQGTDLTQTTVAHTCDVTCASFCSPIHPPSHLHLLLLAAASCKAPRLIGRRWSG